MIVRDTDLPPDCEDILDCAVEAWELDGLSHAALHLFGDRVTIMSIVDAPSSKKRSLWARYDLCYRLNEYALALVADADPTYQRAFVACGLIAEKVQTAEIADVLASWNYDDHTTGGAMQPWKDRYNVRHDGTPPPRTLGRLQSPKAIRRYVRRDFGDAIRHHIRLATGISKFPWPTGPSESALLDPLFAAQEKARKRRVAAARDKFIIEMKTPSRRLIKQNRKQIVRAAALSEQMLGREPTRAFMRGDPVSIPSPSHGLVFEMRSQRLGGIGHGAMKVSLKADTGDRLADLCLYFDKTPPIDELIAIALHVEAGNAAELVKTGNLLNMTEAGASHPALSGRGKMVDILIFGEPHRSFAFGFDRARQHDLAMRYCVKQRAVYQDAIVGAVWGRNASAVRRFWRKMA